MKVSVITPNYNGAKFLDKYFKSLELDSEYIGEVIIVDNGSSDSSLDYIENNTLRRIARNPYKYQEFKQAVLNGKYFECYGAGNYKFVYIIIS